MSAWPEEAVIVGGSGSNTSSDPDPETISLDFSDDFGVLNYAYALEQLEAAVYAEAADDFYGDPHSVEGQYFDDLAAHEGGHRDFTSRCYSCASNLLRIIVWKLSRTNFWRYVYPERENFPSLPN